MTRAANGLPPFLEWKNPCPAYVSAERKKLVFMPNFIAVHHNKFNKASRLLTVILNQGQGSEHGVTSGCI